MILYIVKQNDQVAWVTNCVRHANVAENKTGFTIQKWDNDTIDSYCTYCYVVTVGCEGGSRVVEVTTDKEIAHRLASSVSAKCRTFEITQGLGVPQTRIQFYKYFVVADPGPGYCDECEEYSCGCVEGDRVSGRGSFSRMHSTTESDDFTNHPFITRRRRYSDDLPERWEVAGCDRREARRVAHWWDSMHSSHPTLEYNVDYRVMVVNGEFEIDHKLLTNLDTEAKI